GGMQLATRPEEVSRTMIEETRNQKIIVLSRTSDSEIRASTQSTQNKFADKALYVPIITCSVVASS
ncbi:hypothetical protein, partial [Listeria monocytogenes]|uniref:hypothetical protein n=1 Tax=Listeria monocytogenes TaxID=1639 RepID=UPI001A9C3B9E